MLALLGAISQEVAGLRKRMTLAEMRVYAHGPSFRGQLAGRDVLLAQTGMGRAQAEEALRLALTRYPVTGIISLGFAGALRLGLQAGDLVLCRWLLLGPAGGNEKPLASDGHLATAALRAGQSTSVSLHPGTSVTAERPLVSAAEKWALGRATGARRRRVPRLRRRGVIAGAR